MSWWNNNAFNTKTLVLPATTPTSSVKENSMSVGTDIKNEFETLKNDVTNLFNKSSGEARSRPP